MTRSSRPRRLESWGSPSLHRLRWTDRFPPSLLAHLRSRCFGWVLGGSTHLKIWDRSPRVQFHECSEKKVEGSVWHHVLNLLVQGLSPSINHPSKAEPKAGRPNESQAGSSGFPSVHALDRYTDKFSSGGLHWTVEEDLIEVPPAACSHGTWVKIGVCMSNTQVPSQPMGVVFPFSGGLWAVSLFKDFNTHSHIPSTSNGCPMEACK